MSDPIDIELKNKLRVIEGSKIPDLKLSAFDSDEILKVLSENSAELMSDWYKFQEIWKANAYVTFKDYDTYLVLIYLVQQSWQGYAKRFIFFSKIDIYNKDIIIEKINLIDISLELGIPKETIRRKINELQERKIIKRKGKTIILSLFTDTIQNPIKSLETFTHFLSRFSFFLSKNDWFGGNESRESIESFTNKHFTVCWSNFLKLQINSMIRSKKAFGDLESWHIWGVILLNHSHYLKKSINLNVLNDNKTTQRNYYFTLIRQKINYGVNASSISDISNIPRATVIRKLAKLNKKKLLKRNKTSEYLLNDEGKMNKKIKSDNDILFKEIAIFVTSFFNLMKKSNLKV